MILTEEYILIVGITGEDLYIETEYFDSRGKGADEWMELGVPNNQWVKTGQFEILETNHY